MPSFQYPAIYGIIWIPFWNGHIYRTWQNNLNAKAVKLQFADENYDILLILVINIEYGYSLEPLRRFK